MTTIAFTTDRGANIVATADKYGVKLIVNGNTDNPLGVIGETSHDGRIAILAGHVTAPTTVTGPAEAITAVIALKKQHDADRMRIYEANRSIDQWQAKIHRSMGG